MEFKFKHDELCALASDLAKLYGSGKYADIKIEAGGEELCVHRVILCSRSKYFEELLEAHEDGKVLHLDVPLEPFKLLLEFIYSGKLDHKEAEGTPRLLDVFVLARRFHLERLSQALSKYLAGNLCDTNVLEIVVIALEVRATELVEKCFAFKNRCVLEHLMMPSVFENLSVNSLEFLLSQTTFYVPETQIFENVVYWSKKNTEANLERILENVRFAMMDLEYPVRGVRPSGIIELPRLFEIMDAQFGSKIGPRIAPAPEVDTEIVHELEATTDIDFLRFKLINLKCPECSFVLDSSVDREEWTPIVDFSKTICKPDQLITFPKRIARYVRISSEHYFDMTDFAVGIRDGPERNFADLNKGAIATPIDILPYHPNYDYYMHWKLSESCKLKSLAVIFEFEPTNYEYERKVHVSLDGESWQELPGTLVTVSESKKLFVAVCENILAYYISTEGTVKSDNIRLTCFGTSHKDYHSIEEVPTKRILP